MGLRLSLWWRDQVGPQPANNLGSGFRVGGSGTLSKQVNMREITGLIIRITGVISLPTIGPSDPREAPRSSR